MNSRPGRDVRLAIAGCGAITENSHLPTALATPGVVIGALVDPSIATAERLARSYALTCRIAGRLEDILGEIDGVVIATPNHTHAALIESCIDHGVAVLVEKPFTTTSADGERLSRKAEEKGVPISVGYRTRHYANVRLMKELLDTRYFGAIRGFRYEFGSAGGWAPVSGYNLSREHAGGGVLVVTGTHFLDRMLYWFGEPVEYEYWDDSYGGVEANCQARFRFRDGDQDFTGELFFSKSMALRNRFEMDTDAYRCVIPESDTTAVTLMPRSHPGIKFAVTETGTRPKPDANGSFLSQMEEFAEVVRKLRAPSVDGMFATRSIRWIEKMYGSRKQLPEPWRLFGQGAN